MIFIARNWPLRLSYASLTLVTNRNIWLVTASIGRHTHSHYLTSHDIILKPPSTINTITPTTTSTLLMNYSHLFLMMLALITVYNGSQYCLFSSQLSIRNLMTSSEFIPAQPQVRTKNISLARRRTVFEERSVLMKFLPRIERNCSHEECREQVTERVASSGI